METKNRIPVMTLLLILINVVVYLYVEIHGSSYDAEYMKKWVLCMSRMLYRDMNITGLLRIFSFILVLITCLTI